MSFKFIQEALKKIGVERFINSFYNGENYVLNVFIYLSPFSALMSFPLIQAYNVSKNIFFTKKLKFSFFLLVIKMA